MSKKKKIRRQPPMKMDYETIRAQEQERKKKRREKNRPRRRKALKIACIITASAAVLAAAGTGTFFYLKKSGWFLQHKTAMSTEHFGISDAVMAYYYGQCIESYQSYMAQDESAAQLDLNQPLKEQYYVEGYSFYDMLMDKTLEQISAQLQVCESAYAAGYTLPEEEKELAKTMAAEKDLSLYQKGITRENLEEAIELTLYAQNYQSELMDAVTVTEKEMDDYLAENRENYLNLSIDGFTFPYDTEESETDYGMTKEEAMKYAGELADCKTPAAFEAYVEKYLRDVKQSPEEEIRLNLENLRTTNLITYFGSEIQEWARSKDAKQNAVLLSEMDEKNIIQVCLMLEAPEPSLEPTVDLRVLVLSTAQYDSDEEARAQAEEIAAEFREAGAASDAFAQLAYEHSTDVLTYPNGGLVKGFTPGKTTYGNQLGAWAFDQSRQHGDLTIVEGLGSVIIAYFESASEDCGWQSLVRQALVTQKQKELNTEIHQAAVNTNTKNLKYITGQ